MQYIWLIPLLPAIGAVINGLIGVRSFSRKTAGAVAILMMTAALGVSLVAFWQLLGLPADARAYDVNIADWIPAIPLQTHDGIGRLQIPWGFRLDPLSGMMLLVVTGIGTLIHVYSTAYMADEPRGGVAQVLLLSESVLLLHAPARPGQQLPGDVRRAGKAWVSRRTC